jgi:hypothetical protein
LVCASKVAAAAVRSPDRAVVVVAAARSPDRAVAAVGAAAVSAAANA